MKKLLLWGGLGLVLLVAGVIVATVMSINPIVEKAVNTFGPDLLGAKVHLDKSDLSIFSGQGTLSGLFVGNPKGYETESALRLGSVSVAVDKASLATDRIVINDITVTAPKITYELAGRVSNLQALANNVAGVADREGAAEASRGQAGKEEPGSKQKIQIDNLLIAGGEISLSVKGLGGKAMTVALPDIRLTGIGKDEKGTSPAEAFAQVMAAVSKSAGGAATGALGDLGKTLEQGVQELTKDPEGLKKGVEDLGQGLKKLFQ
ncbi:hypothetical protein [Desulfocurvus sp. DL9XJH121]